MRARAMRARAMAGPGFAMLACEIARRGASETKQRLLQSRRSPSLWPPTLEIDYLAMLLIVPTSPMTIFLALMLSWPSTWNYRFWCSLQSVQSDIPGSTGVQQICYNSLSSLRSFHGISTHRFSRLIETGNITSSISVKHTAGSNQAPLLAKVVGSAGTESLVGNGVDVEDFDVDSLSLNQVSSQKNGSTSAQNGDLILAAVDMGTNSFHMVVVRADKQGRFQLMDTEKEDVRLGSGSSDLSVITPDAEIRALAALKRFKTLAQIRKAEMRVVATSAVREARNRRTFVQRVRDAVGLDVEVLSGTEEACLIYQGVLQALPVFEKTVLVVDIGGGSTEFVLGNRGKPTYATSLKLGHIRLSQQFLSDGPNKKEELKKEQVEELRRHIRVILADSGVIDQVQANEFEVAIGSSGTIESIEQMIHYTVTTTSAPQVVDGQQNKGSLRDREFTADELNQAVKKICKVKTVEQRAKIPGLPEKRADVIVAGAVLLEEFFLALGITKMKVSPYALREGVVVDTLAETLANYKPGVNIRKTSILNLALKFKTDQRMESAQHSAGLAKEILSGLQTCRTGTNECVSDVALLLNDGDADLLEAATSLHYVGMFINHKSYHKHSYYLIKNNEHLLGYSPLEIEILALLARYHRKKVPSQKDEDFAKLPEEAVVPAIDPTTGKARDVSLEVWAAQHELPYFEKIFKRRSSIIVADEHDLEALDTDAPSVSLSS
uniref:Exopolyphosphatase n=1 Tax=Physcomitrium patens TaxID=3218 RepID=Q1EMW4_PHYPA|nr:exopolyphosphatase [Physcomitrium patens]